MKKIVERLIHTASSGKDTIGPATLGEILRSQRKKLGKTRQEIAVAIGVSNDLLYLIENGLAEYSEVSNTTFLESLAEQLKLNAQHLKELMLTAYPKPSAHLSSFDHNPS